MLNDIVIDTNVLLHSQNPNEQRFVDSNKLIIKILNATTDLCVDEGFNDIEANNRSFIGAEYLNNINPGSTVFSFIVELGHQGRIKQLKRRASNLIHNKINQLIRNRTDRVFLNVAYNSIDRILVSHDFKDFQVLKRQKIKSELSIHVLEALECFNCF